MSNTVEQVACALVNRLFLKIPMTTGPKTRAEAARPWTHVLNDEGLPIEYDSEREMFVIRDDENDKQENAGNNGERSAEQVEVTRVPAEETASDPA